MDNENSIGQHAPSTQDRAQPCHPTTESTENVAPAPARAALWGNIPQELRDRPQWCLAAPDKAPLIARGCPYAASVTRPTTWTTFRTAWAFASIHDLHIGYVLSVDDPFTVIDLDVKDADNEPDPKKWTTPEQIARFVSIQQDFDSFSERSRSGKGLHIWIKANIGPGHKRDGVEIYSEARFIICTGDVYEDKPISERQALAETLTAEMGPTTRAVDLVELPPVESDDEVYWKARSYAKSTEKFDRLWNGDWQGYPSQSEADEALLSYLVHATPSNEQVRRLFRWSGLGRRKKAQRDSYLNYTLRRFRATLAAMARMEAGWLR